MGPINYIIYEAAIFMIVHQIRRIQQINTCLEHYCIKLMRQNLN